VETSTRGTAAAVVFLAAMGGLVSVQQRLQSASDVGDQLYNVSELMHAKSALVSAVSGATFAAVLFLLITAGLLEGGLFPGLRPPLDEGHTAPAASPPMKGSSAATSPVGNTPGQPVAPSHPSRKRIPATTVERKTWDIPVGSATPLHTCKLTLESLFKRPPFTFEISAAPDMVELNADPTALP
jgi:hypothetical protein